MQHTQPERDIYIAVYGQVGEEHSLETNQLLASCDYIGRYQTPAQFALYQYKQKPVVIRGGNQALDVKIYAVNLAELKQMDSYFRYPTVHDRIRCDISGFGSAWLYVMCEGYAALAGVYESPLKQEKSRQESTVSA
ncbi:gamma-glutamylcyclotransferase [Celerinatantimonas sp. MCCC 1A17872]|uniref:gamma-glutamylcyclotransferase n=1 Tax=Celerinatantimonas sp. MCCC 1A17872 TaxID=3177514 RepID=UPI0038C6AE66